MKIYLTRHGQTEWNVENRMQGWKDSKLTNEGINNAISLSKSLKDIKFDTVYASTSNRAIETAKFIIGQNDTNLVLHEDLREINMGAWEGRTHEEIKQSFPTQYKNFWENPTQYEPAAGETFEQFVHRVVSIFHTIISNHQDENILIVTHAVFLKALLMHVKGKSITNLWDPPFLYGTSLTVLEMKDGNYNIQLEGDTTHFDKVVTI
ncbi:histidine phosphatase family protein [Bacillus sp. 3103sda1]|uniref:histidine phosphatase family protein n=1 Tax=Bacillus sp. 3103sda1 TaxID=2953808 RepID=UPI00209DF7BA|nr:histidine phosphatase family protein [Bacillus sp. 3103sda1]MCP1123765.1 histidine phosphatase family protein [Bacillus sp. 3103sda1]